MQRQVRVRLPGTVERPILIFVLIAINVALFALNYLAPETAFNLYNAWANDPQLSQTQWYRLFTSMFLHGNEAHLLFNGIALYVIGSVVERLYGRWRLLLIYLLGGLGGSLLSLLFNEGGIGASGAVFAVWGAEVVYLYRHRDLYGKWARSRLRESLFIMGFNFLFGLASNAYVTATQVEGVLIGNWAHLGGLIGGALLAWKIGPRFRVPPDQQPQLFEGDIWLQGVDDNPPSAAWVGWLAIYGAGLIGLLLLSILIP